MSGIIEIRACRACLNTKYEDLQYIFSNGLAAKFQFCFDIKVSDTEFAPNFLCKECVNLVTSFAEFKEKCLKSDSFWRSTNRINTDNNVKQIETENEIISVKNIKCENNIIDLHTENDMNNDCTVEADSDGYNGENDLDFQEEIKKIKLKRLNRRKTPRFTSVNGKRALRKVAGQCDGCDKVFSYHAALVSHLQVCGTKTKKKSENKLKPEINIEQTLIKKQETDSEIYCGLCENTMKNKRDLTTHLHQHEKAETLSCSLCNFEPIDPADFVAHRYKHLPSDGYKIQYKCHKRGCTKLYHNPLSFEFHFRKAHLGKTPGLCRSCDKTYTNIKCWKAHLRSHISLPSYKCDTCGKGFYVKHRLIQHLEIHSDKKNAMCDLCGFSTKRASFIKTHIQNMHGVRTLIPCPVCGKAYKNDSALKHHVLVKHTEKKFTCAHCGKGFATKLLLRDHELWHSDLRPYKCHLCDRAHKSKSNLIAHMHSHNTGKSFMCDVCLKCFSCSRNLAVHRRRNKHCEVKGDKE